MALFRAIPVFRILAPGLIATCLLIALPSGGCAFMNRENPPLLNCVENNLWPEETALQVVCFPIIFPLGLCAVTIDAFAVHPANVVCDSASDTEEALWDGFEWDEHYVTECAALPWRAAFTPVVFTTVFIGRALFDIPNKAAKARRKHEEAIEERERRNRELKSVAESDDPVERWNAFREASADRVELARVLLSDDSSVLRYAALLWIENRHKAAKFTKELERISKEDPDPVIREFAGQMRQ